MPFFLCDLSPFLFHSNPVNSDIIPVLVFALKWALLVLGVFFFVIIVLLIVMSASSWQMLSSPSILEEMLANGTDLELLFSDQTSPRRYKRVALKAKKQAAFLELATSMA